NQSSAERTKRARTTRAHAKAPKASKPAQFRAAQPKSDQQPNAWGHSKTTICHATGSATNPYVTISIPQPAIAAHQRHQDGRDIIPAPAEGCPTAAAAP